MNSPTSPTPPRGALLDELDSLRFSGIAERNEEEDGLDRETDERAGGETRWQVRSLTEVPAQVYMDEMDEDPEEEAVALPPEMRRRLEREAAAEEAPQTDSIKTEQAQKLKRRRASSS